MLFSLHWQKMLYPCLTLLYTVRGIRHPPSTPGILLSVTLHQVDTALVFLLCVHTVGSVHGGRPLGHQFMHVPSMLPCTFRHWAADFLPVPLPKQSWSALWLRKKGHVLLSWIILFLSLGGRSPKGCTCVGGCMPVHLSDPSNWHFIPLLASVATELILPPAAPSITTTLDTLVSLAFLARGIIFFSSDMGDPHPVGSAMSMFSASFYFYSTNFSNLGSTAP